MINRLKIRLTEAEYKQIETELGYDQYNSEDYDLYVRGSFDYLLDFDCKYNEFVIKLEQAEKSKLIKNAIDL